MNPRRTIGTAAALAAALSFAPAARADVTKSQCIEANTSAQSLRREGKLSEARAALAVCSDAQCPALVRDDCTRQLDVIAQEQPTVVFDAKDGAGADLSAVRVTVDGRALTDHLDGTALPLDAGTHVFVFEAAGVPATTVTLVIKVGETRRRVDVTLAVPGAKPAASATGARTAAGGAGATDTVAPATTTDTNGNRRTLGWVAAGAGGVGLAAGTLFGILAASKWSATKNDCATSSCPSYSQAVSDHGATVTFGTASTVGFVAGAALLGVGAVLLFTTPSSSHATSAQLDVRPGGLAVSGTFQ